MNRKPSTPSRGSARATARLSTALVALLLVAPTGALAAAPPADAAHASFENDARGPPMRSSAPTGGTGGTEGHALPQCGPMCMAAAISAAAAVMSAWAQYCADQPNKPSCWWADKPGEDGGDGGDGGNGGNGGAGCRGRVSVSLSGCCPGEGGSGGRGGDGGNGGSGRNSGEPGNGGDAGDEGDSGEDGTNGGLGVTDCGSNTLPRVHLDSD